MALLGSKWMIALLIIVAVLVILYIAGRKSAHSEIIIEASTSEVWSILTDVPQIKEWNSVLIPLEGDLRIGNTVNYEFHQDENNVSTMPAKVKQMIDAELLNQGGGIPGVLTFDHRYILEEVNEGTKVIIHEEYRGIMVPFWNPDPVERAYGRLLEELRERVIKLKESEG